MTTLGTFNQASWAGVGDIDECWIIATYWALVATGIMTRDQLPTIAEFREAAGRPDKPGPSGGNNKVLMLALKTLIPQADAKMIDGSFQSFKAELGRGYVASLSVLSSKLPKWLQFGFQGAHQVSVYFKGGQFYLANPLAKEGSALIQISEADLKSAAGGLFGDGKFHAVLIKGKTAALLKNTLAPTSPPRDLAAPIIVRDYIDPWRVQRDYDARHKRGG